MEYDKTEPGTRRALRERVTSSTKESAVLGAVARLGGPTPPSTDVLAEELAQLYEHGREAGRLQRSQDVADADAERAKYYEQVTRLTQQLERIRTTAKRLREEGATLPTALVDTIWPKEIR